MKLEEIKKLTGAPLTEIQECSSEFAALILNEQANGNIHEVDGDALLANIDRMIVEAEQHGKAES